MLIKDGGSGLRVMLVQFFLDMATSLKPSSLFPFMVIDLWSSKKLSVVRSSAKYKLILHLEILEAMFVLGTLRLETSLGGGEEEPWEKNQKKRGKTGGKT